MDHTCRRVSPVRKITITRRSRLLLCLLLFVFFVSQWSITGRCEDTDGTVSDEVVETDAGPKTADAGALILNASGNRNIEPSVDPVESTEGFSAVLYNNTNGLPTSDANAIAQTEEGFLWIGSYAGLIRYDGNNFERIDSTHGIANVRCLYVDSRDRLWIGTNDAGVFVLERGVYRKWDREDGLTSVSIRTITEDADGRIYIAGAAAGIATIDTELNLTVLRDARVDGKSIPDLRCGSDGLVYGFTQDGALFALKDGAVDTFLSGDACPVRSIQSILPDPVHPGGLYVGTENSEIWYGNLKGGASSGEAQADFTGIYVRDISPLLSVNGMEYVDGRIWICAGNGIGRLDADEKRPDADDFRHLSALPMNNAVEQMMTDFDGNLWFVSSHQGVMKIVRNRFLDLFEKYGLTKVVVNSTCMHGRRLFMGTDTGLIVMDGENRVESIPLTRAVTASGKEFPATDLVELLDGVRIRCIKEDSRGRLWIPTWHKYGLLCFDNGELTVFSKEDGLFSDAIRVTCECEDGSVLAANTGGISVIKDGRVTGAYGEESGIVNGEILTVTEGFSHELVLGSDGDGIYIIGPEGTRHIGREEGLQSEIILRIKRSAYNNVYWIVTGNSLAYMTPDYRVTTIRHFPYPNNYDLYENSKGDVWILSSAGIYVTPGEDLLSGEPFDPVFLGRGSGLPYIATANARSELTPEGDLYIASSEGVVKVNIEKPFENLSNLRISLPFIDADGERFYPDDPWIFIIPGHVKKLTLYPYVFIYSLTDPQVTCRLQGFDQTDATVSRSRLVPVDYTNLKNGTYDFVMTVKDPVGHTEQTVSFRIDKGRTISAGAIGTIIMNAVSLLLLGGIMIYTSLYRKRGRLKDKLFFDLILANAAMDVVELLSYLVEYTAFPFARALMIAGSTVFSMILVFFPYLLLVYIDYSGDSDESRVRKAKLLYAIPCLLSLVLLIINLKTGWIFSIDEGNVFKSGPHHGYRLFTAVPVLFYYLPSLVKIVKTDKHLAVLGAVLLITRTIWALWYPDISSTSFMYTLVLVCAHLYELNLPLYEEVS